MNNVKINIIRDLITNNRQIIFVYKSMIKLYILGDHNLQIKIDEFKQMIFKFVNKKILNKFLNK